MRLSIRLEASWSLAIWALLVCTGCESVHLHNSTDAERAKGALETYESIDLDTLISTGLENATALTESEKATRRKLHRVAQQIELVDIIAGGPLG